MRAFLITIALLLTTLLTTGWASAEVVCDAGVICPDNDRDGFAACGCPWSGTPCDCDDDDPVVFPGAPETCDSTKERSCNATTPDPCGKTEGCWNSACVPECIPLDDFGCAGGSSFAKEPDSGRCLCAPMDCTIFGCPRGQTCDDEKRCVLNCGANVQCPFGQLCRGFGCVDPCTEVACPKDSVCDRGRCLPACSCASCPDGESCDPESAKCMETACIGLRCNAGSHCERGKCVDDCVGVVCPPKRVCRKEPKTECADLCNPDPCAGTPGMECDWRTGTCKRVAVPEGGLSPPPPTPIESLEEVGGAGWLCTTNQLVHGSAWTLVVTACALMMLALRRRR